MAKNKLIKIVMSKERDLKTIYSQLHFLCIKVHISKKREKD